MPYNERLQEQIRTIIHEVNYYTNLLYVLSCTYTRNMILNLIRDRLATINFLLELSGSETGTTANLPVIPKGSISSTIPSSSTKSGIEKIIQGIAPSELQNLNSPTSQNSEGSQVTFTVQELSKYNGKNGNPAYVAVNGIVYDVTNNAAWAAATHFGLVAGRDLTGEFASCHAGQNILSKLKTVGRLIQ
ncbi:cytochrome b5 domain-containing protein [Acetivibrio cellulolyticus]|uniref:cytochrome b5 domain-containing protein n=1 Tax=Acetivibrio cellulolyticus TaxID=35830 RepID=UPI0001E2D106|nr:cytochrome b5 domain-containing protein [Acetivibrio cellulolyticus]